jgi:hypothetical protein
MLQVYLVALIAAFSLLVSWFLELNVRFSFLYPGLYSFPLLLAMLGAEASWQEVVG